MHICLRLTSIATLLIGLQLLSPKMFPIQAEHHPLNNNSSNYASLASNSNNSKEFSLIQQSATEDFTPPDNGYPNNTRGSGTR
jgi:hypothetical protein